MTLAESSDSPDRSPGTANGKRAARADDAVSDTDRFTSAARPIMSPQDTSQFEGLRQQIDTAWQRHSAEKLFGPPGASGHVYLWGMAAATNSPIAENWQRLTACTGCTLAKQVEDTLPGGSGKQLPNLNSKTSKKSRKRDRKAVADNPDGNQATALGRPDAMFSAWATDTASRYLEESRPTADDAPAALTSVIWASAMPMLMRVIPPSLWWDLLGELQQRRERWWHDTDSSSACRLIGVGELGLTLAWRLKPLPSCHRLASTSLETVREFFDGGEETLSDVLRQPSQMRLVMASIQRLKSLLPRVTKRKLRQDDLALAFNLAAWVAAMTRHDGTPVFSNRTPSDVTTDLSDLSDLPTHPGSRAKKGSTKKDGYRKSGKQASKRRPESPAGGLLGAMTCIDEEALSPAVAASLGQSPRGGRLAWEVSLPEAMWHDDEAGVAALLPEWDVRRGRTFVDYRGPDVVLEIMAGRRLLIDGVTQTMIDVDGQSQQPTGPWQSVCQYTDDDVHYLEIEQAYSGGVTLQRQIMVVRDDRCVMLSDAVVPTRHFSNVAQDQLPSVRCLTRVPLAAGISVETDEETRELFLGDKKRRALAVPLAASEWRIASTHSRLEVSDDRHLILTTTGRGAIYSPLWLDFQPRRFRRKRTWRQLTVADRLQILPRNVASAFRMQIGSEHWVVYRGLTSTRESTGVTPRSFLGKHMVAEFFAARFHPGDGGMEDLVTVDRDFD